MTMEATEILKEEKKKRFDLYLVPIIILSAFLNLYKIWEDQTSNAYYTSAVKSMLQSWHNFFYVSFDPGGFVTIDKPPVAFWIQTISAKIFGLHGWSVILPQALAGIGSVILMYVLIKPSFGKIAGRIAALTMALTPIVPAVSRTNNIDSLLVFTLLIATWMLFRAVRNHKIGWLLGAFAAIGIGFNIKMLQAYMILPAFFVFYILATKINWRKRAGVLTAATALMLAISVSWAVVVDMTPASKRPYVGSSQTNSVLELAFGYNGINRLTGQAAPGRGQQKMQKQMSLDVPKNLSSGTASNNQTINQTNQNQAFSSGNNNRPSSQTTAPSWSNGKSTNGMQRPGGSQNGMFNTGTPGPFRLFQQGLADQISWLLPFALFSIIGLLAGLKLKGPYTARQKETLFWTAWLVPVGAFFSIAGFFHQYYLIMLAPPITALVGAGSVTLWNLFKKQDRWKTWLLPGALLTTALLQVYIMSSFVDSIGMAPLIIVGGLEIILTLVLLMKKERSSRVTRFIGTAAMAVLLAVPAFWSMTPIIYGDNSSLPSAGPTSYRGGMPQANMLKNIPGEFPTNGQPQMSGNLATGGQPQMSGNLATSGKSQMSSFPTKNRRSQIGQSLNQKLLKFLLKNNNGEKYLFATTNANTAAPYIIQTGKPVMTMGGFTGSDPILTVNKLKELVQKGEVKYFLIGGNGGMGGSSSLTEWIKKNGKEVSSVKWQSGNGSGQQQIGLDGAMALYEVTL